MNSSTTKLTLAIMLGAIGSLLIAGVAAATVNADINNPKGDVKFQNTKTVIVNIKGGKDGKDGKDGRDGTDGANGLNGKDGVNGTSGAPGLNGINGTNGQDGAPGRDGVNGTSGVDGRDGINGTNGVNGVDGRDATATILLNVSNGQQIVCTVGAGANDIGCIDVNENGTVVIPPVTNDTGNGTVIEPPIDNGSGTVINDTGGVIPPNDNQTGGNTTEPVQCQPGTHDENGTCVVDAVIPPVDNQTGNGTSTGNETGPVIVDNSTGTVVIDNNTNATG